MCFSKQYLTSHNRQIEWTCRSKYTQNKNLWFCPNTEDKKVKLLLTTQQNQLFCYHVLMGKTNWFSRCSHWIYSKNKQTNKQTNKAVQKSVVNFTFARQIVMIYFTPFQTRGFCLLQAVRLSNKTYNTAIPYIKYEQTRSEWRNKLKQ